jgi:hypothetical protein
MKKYDDKDKGKWDFMKLTDFVNIKKLGKFYPKKKKISF